MKNILLVLALPFLAAAASLDQIIAKRQGGASMAFVEVASTNLFPNCPVTPAGLNLIAQASQQFVDPRVIDRTICQYNDQATGAFEQCRYDGLTGAPLTGGNPTYCTQAVGAYSTGNCFTGCPRQPNGLFFASSTLQISPPTQGLYYTQCDYSLTEQGAFNNEVNFRCIFSTTNGAPIVTQITNDARCPQSIPVTSMCFNRPS